MIIFLDVYLIILLYPWHFKFSLYLKTYSAQNYAWTCRIRFRIMYVKYSITLFDYRSRLHSPPGSPITCVVIAHPLRKLSRTWDCTASRANLFDYGRSNHWDALQGSEKSSISLESSLINPNFVLLDDMGLVHFFKWQFPDVWIANVEFSFLGENLK